MTKIISDHEFLAETREDSTKETLQKGEDIVVEYDQYLEYRYNKKEDRQRVIQGREPEVGKEFFLSPAEVESSQGEKKVVVKEIDVFAEEKDNA